MQPLAYLQSLHKSPINEELQRRVQMTTSCDDCASIPKIERAGEVLNESPWPVQLMHNGVRVAQGGYYGPWLTKIITDLKGHHEPQEEKVFHHVLNSLGQASTMIELGAFWSYYSLWFLDRFPEARSILVEPDSNNLGIGQYNFGLNNRKGTFIQAAVGATPAPPEPFLCESDFSVQPVPRVSVDSLVEEHGLSVIDILLADIQGAELSMLNGMKRTLEDRRLRYLLVSTHDGSISGDYAMHQHCLQWIKDHGGHIIAEHTVDESFSGDGLIAASFHQPQPLSVSISHNRADHSMFGSPSLRLAQMTGRLAALAPAAPSAASDVFSGVKRMQQQIKSCHGALQRRLRLEAAPKSSWWSTVSSFRKLKRHLAERQMEKQALTRLHSLRKRKSTEVVLGLHGLFEVLKDEKVISPAVVRDLHWEMEGLKQAVKWVQASTGKSLKSATLLDIGASLGMVGVQILASGRMKRCIAIEPDPTNFALLWSNVRLSGLQHAFELHPVALGQQDASCSLELSPTHGGDHRVRLHPSDKGKDAFEESTREVISVPMQKLDGLLDTCPGDFTRKIGLCWMEVRGFEAEVIQGGLKHLEQHGWPTVIEFWPYGLARMGVEPAGLQTLLARVWTKLAVLEGSDDEPVWHPLSHIEALWKSTGTGGKLVKVLLMR